jgi:hypothetical protein
MKEQKGCRWISATGDTDSNKILIKISHIVLSLCVTCSYKRDTGYQSLSPPLSLLKYHCVYFVKKEYINFVMILREEINFFEFF